MPYVTELLNYVSLLHSVVLYKDITSNFGPVPSSVWICIQYQRQKQSNEKSVRQLIYLHVLSFVFQIHWGKKPANNKKNPHQDVKTASLILKVVYV